MANETPPETDENVAGAPDFPELQRSPQQDDQPFEVNRFAGVQVAITAELGRTKLSLMEMMNLNEGSVIELHRNIGEPVELVAQGVPLGNGEVVVIDDQFAVCIKEIYQS